MITILLNIILLDVNVDKFTIELYFLFKLSILNKSTEQFFFFPDPSQCLILRVRNFPHRYNKSEHFQGSKPLKKVLKTFKKNYFKSPINP